MGWRPPSQDEGTGEERPIEWWDEELSFSSELRRFLARDTNLSVLEQLNGVWGLGVEEIT